MTISKLSTSASLKQVMDKFEELSAVELLGIDVITTQTLPSTVKNGRLVILCDSYNEIKFDIAEDNIVEGDIFIKYALKSKYNFHIKNKKINAVFNITSIKQFKGNEFSKLTAYIGVNNQWVEIKEELNIYTLGTFDNKDIVSTFSKAPTPNSYGSISINFRQEYIELNGKANAGVYNVLLVASSDKKIDFTNYKKLYVENLNASGTSVQILSEHGSSALVNVPLNNGKLTEIDVSSVNMNAYLYFYCLAINSSASGTANFNAKITKIWLE